MKLNGKRIFLEPFAQKHLVADSYLTWINDIDVVRYIGREELLDGTTYADLAVYVQSVWDDPLSHFFAVHDQDTRKFIGTTKINYISNRNQRANVADIGIMIGERSCWGQGLSKDILLTICRFAFDELGARKLTAGVMSDNESAGRAFRSIGFKEEARLRDQLATESGFCDHVLFGCFPGELLSDYSSKES